MDLRKVTYRSDIDGLRAIAVLAVILFHAGIGIVPGGFFGVDVFFVISGYLITQMIRSDIAWEKFSILEFYNRRARRIFPAMLVMVLACLPLAWLWMTPKELGGFSKALMSLGFFSSNIYFKKTSNYFSPENDLNPLLHTWSLGVEEQFYFFFPLILWITWHLDSLSEAS